MCRKMLIGLLVVGVLGLASSAYAGNEFNWTNGTANQLWNTPGNWDQGIVPTNAVGGEAQIDMTGPNGCIVNANGNAAQVLLGKFADGEMTVNAGATFTVDSWVSYLGHNAGNTGTLNMNGGTWLQDGMTFAVGEQGHGILNMNDGLIDITNNKALVVADAGGSGVVNLDGGTIIADWFTIRTDQGYINITEGTLIVRNITDVSGFIANGWIEGYGGAGEVHHDTTTNPGMTTVWATPEPASLALLALGGLVGLRRRRIG